MMGNFLSFIDIYNQSYTAAQNGDYLTVTLQLGRLFRRMFDFKGMERVTLTDVLALTYSLLEQPKVSTNLTDPWSLFVNSFFGFVDGAFEAKYIPQCKSYLRQFFTQLDNSNKATTAD